MRLAQRCALTQTRRRDESEMVWESRGLRATDGTRVRGLIERACLSSRIGNL
ncbi:hypothetical protein BH160DRAFT_2225 [Burkholderia sp. H160]|nr:hypothetical protein BH160DRAFT_2225 [Burkholderia sp. H160]